MNSKKIEINGREIEIIPTPFDGKLEIEDYEKQLFSALFKIGVSQKFITIENINQTVKISWIINNQNFSFSCIVYDTFRENLGACVQAIKEDVRHILRGIKQIDLVLKQYATEEVKIKQLKKKNLFDFQNEESLTTSNISSIKKESTDIIEILNENHAKQIIEEIKSKYPQFSNYSFLPDIDRVNLEKAYIYLGRKPHWK